MLADNQQGGRITTEALREEVESSQFILVDYRWARKAYQKANGLADWPEEECHPPKLTAEDLASRRVLIEKVLNMVDGSPDEKTRKLLEVYAQGGDHRIGIALHGLVEPMKVVRRATNVAKNSRPVPPSRRERLRPPA
jgi:hypothetical protein